MTNTPRHIIDPRQLPEKDKRRSMFIFKCRVTMAEYAVLNFTEDKAFWDGPARMGWTRVPDPDADPKDPKVLKYKYYSPSAGQGPQLIITDKKGGGK